MSANADIRSKQNKWGRYRNFILKPLDQLFQLQLTVTVDNWILFCVRIFKSLLRLNLQFHHQLRQGDPEKESP